MEKRLLVVGSINIDLVASAARLPAPGETILGRTFDTFNGGKGANQAVAIAKLGEPVAMIGAVGSDLFAERLLSGLESAGVDVQGVQTVDGPCGVALISKADNGDNSIIVVAGANHAVTAAYLDAQVKAMQQASMILVQLETPMEAVLRLAELAAQENVPLMLDPAPAAPLANSVLSRVTWLTPNETEARVLLGLDHIDPPAAAKQLLAMGVRNVALKLGSQGVFLCGRDCAAQSIPAFQVNAIDTTAAGDCFNAAFAVSLMRGSAPADAARYASAAAAISVTRAGAQPSLPTSAEVDTFLQKT